MILKANDFVGKGGLACVFRSGNGVVKLFRRQDMIHGDDPQTSETIIRAVWDSECSAYEVLRAVESESSLVSHYLGRIRVDDVVDAGGQSVGGAYILDCAYEMVHLEGRPLKRTELGCDVAQVDAIVARWRMHGVKHTIDASFYSVGDAICSVIDFALRDEVDVLGTEYACHGSLPADVVSRCGAAAT